MLIHGSWLVNVLLLMAFGAAFYAIINYYDDLFTTLGSYIVIILIVFHIAGGVYDGVFLCSLFSR